MSAVVNFVTLQMKKTAGKKELALLGASKPERAP
jgi:hypothetical protein